LSLVDIIIVNFNSTDYVLSCIQSIEDAIEEDAIANIFVEDNHSSDQVERINTRFPHVFLTINPRNIGFAAAINRALTRSSAPFVVLLNPDSIVNKDFIKTLLAYMANHPDVGIVSPKILNSDGTVQGSARSFPTPMTALFGRSSFLSRCFPNNKLTSQNILTHRSDGKTPIEVDWVSGACMMIRRKAFLDVGYLDEHFFMYWEDADLCKRFWDHGWKVVYYPKVEVIHFVGGSSEKSPIKSILEFHKSSFKIFFKYSNPTYRFFSPFVATALMFRMVLVAIQNRINARINKYSYLQPAINKPECANRTKRIQLLRIISRLNIGGPSIHTHLLAAELDKTWFQSTLVSGKISPMEGDMSYLFSPSEIQPIIIPELQREISLVNDSKAFLQILKIIFRERPDILHTHTAKAGSIARMAAMIFNLVNRNKVKTVHTFHGHVFKGYFKKSKSMLFVLIERLLEKFTDTIIAISQTQKMELSKQFRIAPDGKIRTIELGFDLKPFLNCQSFSGQFRQQLGVGADAILIGIVGRLVSIKNHRMFFNSIEIYKKLNPKSKVKFVVVGDGELRRDLESYCKRHRLRDHAIFCGWIKNVAMVYADLDILTLTSLNEGTPVSIIEAMASSVPVIATDAGGVRDLLGKESDTISQDGFAVCERGILCKKNDVKSFAKGINYLTLISKKEESCVENKASIQNAVNFISYRRKSP